MKAVVFHGVGSIGLEDRDRPVQGADGTLLRVLSAGVCMTDVHILLGHFPVAPPRVLGHELIGVVELTGAEVDPVWLGRTAAVRPARFCGRCWPCRHGKAHLCTRFQCTGSTEDGGFAEYVVVRADQLVPLDGMSPDRAVWMEPLSCVLHAIEVAGADSARSVLICGAGTFGQLTIRALKLMNVGRIAVVDPNPAKIERALDAGAEAGWVVPREGVADEVGRAIAAWAGESLGAIIETTGKAAALERAVAWATAGTRIVLFGVSDPLAPASLSMAAVLSKEIDLTASSGMTVEAFAAAAHLLADGRLDTDGLVEEIIGLDALPDALKEMTRRSTGKVLVHPG